MTFLSARRRLIALVAFASLVDGYDIQSMGLAVPLMAVERGLPPASFGPALTATIAGMIVGALALAPLGDQFGKVRLLAAAMAVVAIGSLLTVLVDPGLPLIASRLFVGVGIGGAVPAAVSIASEIAPPKHRSLLVTAVVVATGFGSFLASMIAPVITSWAGDWRAIFMLGAAMPALCAVLLWPMRGGGSEITTGGGKAMAGSPLALLDRDNRRATLALWLLMPISLAVTYTLTTWLPTLLHGAGWPVAAAQRATGLLALGGIAGGLVLGWLADRWRFRATLGIAYLLAVAAFATMVATPATGWMPALLVVGCTSFGAVMMLGAGTPRLYPAGIRTTATGWASGIGRMGALAGPLLVTLALGAGVAPHVIVTALAMPSILCAVLVTRLPAIDRSEPV